MTTPTPEPTPPEPTPVLPPTDEEVEEVVLSRFAVLARFRRPAGSAHEAEVQVRHELEPARDLFDDVRVEPQEPDGRWAVDVRFVVASLDNERAVEGVHETLRGYGIAPDEAWVGARLP